MTTLSFILKSLHRLNDGAGMGSFHFCLAIFSRAMAIRSRKPLIAVNSVSTVGTSSISKSSSIWCLRLLVLVKLRIHYATAGGAVQSLQIIERPPAVGINSARETGLNMAQFLALLGIDPILAPRLHWRQCSQKQSWTSQKTDLGGYELALLRAEYGAIVSYGRQSRQPQHSCLDCLSIISRTDWRRG